MKNNQLKIKKTVAKILRVAFCGFLLTAFGCDSTAKRAEKEPKPFDLSFVNGSTGLPSAGQWRQGLAFLDMNGDGNVDILSTPPRLAPTEKKTLWIWYGNGKGEWSPFPLLNLPHKFLPEYGTIAAGDFNGDHIPDIAAAMHGIGLESLKGTESGEYSYFSDGMPPYQEFPTRALTSADINNDGIEDIIAVTEYAVGQGFFTSKGLLGCSYQDGKWKCKQIGDPKEVAGLVADQIVTGDVNADGNIDFAVASRNSRRNLIVWLGDGKGDFIPFNKGLPMEMHYSSVAFADVNKDGREDLIISASGRTKNDFKGLKVLLSGPEGFRDSSDGLPSGDGWPYFASAGDLDGDGNVEIVAATQPGGLEIYGWKGNRWEKLRTSGLPDKGFYQIFGLYCIDVNKDGRKDIAVAHAKIADKGGGIDVFLSTGE